MKLQRFAAMCIAGVIMFTSNVMATSSNSINKVRTVKKNEAITDSYLKIVPKDQVDTGSSIVIKFTNARVPSQDIIDGRGSGNGYKKGGYQYSYCDWDISQGFYDVMPNINTYELPYKIRRSSSDEIEVYLINLPDKYANYSLYEVNGTSTEPCYRINLPIIADGVGTISCKIDSNGTSISGSRVDSASIYSSKSDDDDNSTSSNSSKNTVKNNGNNSKNDKNDKNDDNNTKEILNNRSSGNINKAKQNNTEKSKVHLSIQIGAEKMYVNYKSVDIDAPAYIQKESSSTLVPLRVISVAFSGEDVENADLSQVVEWDAETKTATINYNSKKIKFTAGSNLINIDGSEQEMENGVVAEISNGRMCVPLRAVAVALDSSINWDAETKTAVFETK